MPELDSLPPKARLHRSDPIHPGLPHQSDDRGSGKAEVPRSQVYIDHFECAALRFADRCAVSMGGRSVTYRELDRLANSYLPLLGEAGYDENAIVAVCMERSIELVAALLAVMKSNAAFLPLDPQLPAYRVRTLVKQSGAKAVLTQPDQASLFESSGASVVCLQSAHSPTLAAAAAKPIRRDPSSLAYVIYTSGSTGAPKGVAISQKAFCHYVHWAVNYYSFDPDGVSIVHTSIGFDLTLTSLFCPLLAGMRVLMMPESDGFDAVVRLLEEGSEAVSLLKLTPSHLGLIADAQQSQRRAWNCDVLIVGGEMLTSEQIRLWEARSNRSRVFNEYGPTEATVGCCVSRVASSDAAPDGSLPIGAAIADVSLHVCKPFSGIAQEEAEGELFIAGPCLARGYLDAPARTAEKFVPDPNGSGGRLYASGDWVSKTDGGQLVCGGRKDRQRKINGIRIELGEIESVLRQYPGVHAAAALTIGDQPSQEDLIGFLAVADPESDQIELAALMNFLKDRILHTVVPQDIYIIKQLPLGLSGKADYQKLIRERHSYMRVKDTFLPPRNPTEDLLASLWQAILNLDEVSIDDSFFALDGNSMKSIQFAYEAKKHGLTLSTRDLFEHQTIRRLARLVLSSAAECQTQASVRPGPFALVAAKDRERMPAEVMDAYPLAMLQAGTLFESHHRIGSGTYHNVNSYHIECQLNLGLFQQSLALVMGRHPILRTCYDYVNYAQPLQLVYRETEIPLHVVDISQLPADERKCCVASFIEAESRNAFDWTKPPLLRFFIHIRGRGRLQFTLSKHHSILDGWSAATLIAEIVKNYFALLKNQAPPFRFPVETTYRDYVALEQRAIHSPDFKEFWNEALHDAPFYALRPWGGAKPPRDCAHSSITTRSVPISAELSAGLKEVARRAHTPLKSVLLAVHLRILAQLTGARRVVTGVVSHGRPETTDADKAIGLFINTIPVHLAIAERFTWFDLIQGVFEQERRAFPFQRYPMAQIKKDLGWERLFESIFYYTNFHVFRDFRTSEDLKFIDSAGFEETEIPLTLAFHLHPLTSEVSLDIHFHVDHFSRLQVANVVSYAKKALQGIVSQPQGSVLSWSLLTELESVAICRAGPLKLPSETVFDLFREQARRRADEVALAAGDSRMTYGAMLRRSKDLASLLRQSEICGDRIVGICLSRTSEAIVAMLAVNCADGCFAVLDGQWPQARLGEVLGQLDPALILSDGEFAPKLSRWPYQVLDVTCPLPACALIPVVQQPGLPGELAYIVFTSGSSGQPKGVMVSNAGLTHSTRTRLEFYPNRYERFLLLSRLTFDSSFAGIWGTLCGGGTLYVLDEDRPLDVGQVASLISDESITHFLAIPSLYRVLLPELQAGQCCALQAVIMAGEQLTGDVVEAHRERLPGLAMVNEYGPTEATVWATAAEVSLQAWDRGAGVSIGAAIAHTETLVLDEGMRQVSLGAIGELYIGGPALARGYHQAPRLTAQRFVPNPYAAKESDSMLLYRTGDRVRYYPDGQLHFVGRSDNQLKVRGFRIEPEEIERAFRESYPLGQAMAAVTEESPGRKRICLYCVTPERAEREVPLDAQEVKARLGQRLPGYTLPDDVIEVESLPRLSNNKLDRSAQPTVLQRRSQTANGTSEEPSSEVERTLADLWSEALALPEVGLRQSFFEIGGDSLLANQVVLRAEKVFGAKLLLKEFYQIPTISAHAKLLKKRGEEMGIDFERVASIWNRIG